MIFDLHSIGSAICMYHSVDEMLLGRVASGELSFAERLNASKAVLWKMQTHAHISDDHSSLNINRVTEREREREREKERESVHMRFDSSCFISR